MSDEEWELFKVFPDFGPAEALRMQLEHHGVPTRVESRALEVGLGAQFCVFVAKVLAHRARWVVAQLLLTDAERDYLATGKLPGNDK